MMRLSRNDCLRERQAVRDGVENALQLAMLVGRSLKVPQVGDIFGVQPRLNVREVAAGNLESGPQRAHELDHCVTVSGAKFRIRFDAQTVVVVAPDTDGIRFGQQSTRFFDPPGKRNCKPASRRN